MRTRAFFTSFGLVALAGLLAPQVLFAVSSKQIVLFKQNEVSVTSLDHGQFQQLLQTTNDRDIKTLKGWLAATPLRATPQDLWMIRGATVVLDEAAAARLRKEPWVHSVRPDLLRKWLPVAGPRSARPSLVEAAAATGGTWGLEAIGVPKIRAEFPKIDGAGIRVAVIDSGVQANHAELKGRVVRFRDFVNKLPSAYDDQGHGTHVSGTIAGGAVGVAPMASLTVAKVFAANGSAFDSEILEAMQWVFDPDGNPATSDHPHIVSNSWGGDLVGTGVLSVQEFAPYWLAISAWIHGGIIPVFAAGNSGVAPNGVPGGLPEPISVGAFGPEGKAAEFSSRGPNLWRVGESVLTILKPDISAPGVAIPSALTGNQYATWDGTSMATPHVAGALALALQANPKLKFAELKELLLRSSEKKLDTAFGFGTLNAHELVKLALSRHR